MFLSSQVRPFMRAASQSSRHFQSIWQRCAHAFTLVEVMVSATVLSGAIVALAATFIQAYKLSGVTRYHDAAKNVLLLYVGEFQKADYYSNVVAANGESQINPLFISTLENGRTDCDRLECAGLELDNNPNDQPNGVYWLEVGLPTPPIAQVRRVVYPINDVTGLADRDALPSTAGLIIHANFTITYSYQGVVHTQSMSTLRNVL
jgi:type II secretory pathway pseudopilin PulG